MSASNHLHPKLFHGTHNPNWRNNPGWIHAGSMAQAQSRLDEGFFETQKVGKTPEIHEISLQPNARIYPKVIGTRQIEEDWKDDEGEWYTEPREHDLGMLLEGKYVDLTHPAYSDPSGKPYDVYPYKNIVEGDEKDNISYAVNPKAIKRTKKV